MKTSKKPKLLILVLLAIFAFGCAYSKEKLLNELKRDSTGLIGCPQNEIQIDAPTGVDFNGTWVATCKGRKIYCASQMGGNKGTEAIQ